MVKLNTTFNSPKALSKASSLSMALSSRCHVRPSLFEIPEELEQGAQEWASEALQSPYPHITI